MVLVFHFKVLPFGSAGFTGVDVFYVISGFLITSIITRQLEAGQFSLKTFYLSRVRRLAPALFITLAGVVIAGAIWLFPIDFISLTKEVVAAQTYAANFYYWRTLNYFGLSANSAFLLHTWSLAVEEQFYLIYPLCLLVIHRYLGKYLWPIIFFILLLSFSVNILLVSTKPEATFYLLPTRAWELLIGGMILPALSRASSMQRYSEAAGLIGLAAIAVGFAAYDRGIAFPGWFALFPTLGTALVLWSGSVANTTTCKVLSNRSLGYVGLISYPLYLVHWPITVFASRLLGNEYSLTWRCSMMALSFAAASAVYHLVEQPIRRGRLLASRRTLMAGYISGLAITAASTAVIFTSKGVPQRYPTEVVRLASFTNDRLDEMKECDYNGKRLNRDSDFCFIGKPGSIPQWLVYGDSHAWAAHDAFDEWLRQKNQAGLFIFRHECPPLVGIHLFRDQGACFSFNNKVLKFLEQSKTTENVVLVSTWRQAIEGLLSNSENKPSTVQQSTELFENSFSATIHELKAIGKHIYIWEPVPGAKESVPQTLAEDALIHKHTDIEFSESEYQSTYKFFFDALARNRSFIDRTFSPAKTLCATGKCSVIENGVPLYFDSGHISKSSRDFWVRMLMDPN
jgi:peptidoglycan/LPS O-acetylase OafA/YrhL